MLFRGFCFITSQERRNEGGLESEERWSRRETGKKTPEAQDLYHESI